ncbi:MAG: hypothetical protein ABL307_14465 [Roseitalea porphyridii]|uniref:DUF6958 family protein n=1 Tax=Roseitalea porphyridii TaxID=1852022 RepID=UPI0032D9719B
MADKVEVRNVNVPDRTERVDRAKYEAMKAAMLRILPDGPPGLTGKEVKEAAKPHLPEALFPGGKTAGWWAKTVQLDLEARGAVARSASSPLRFWRTGNGAD